MQQNHELRIGIAGLGTVGGGTVRLLGRQAALLEDRTGVALRLVAVSARTAKPHLPLDQARFEHDPLALTAASDIDVVVELIGGAEGTARRLVEAALKAGKHVVTANKALIAVHGASLAALAEEHNVGLLFEAAVAGGIPAIKTLREGLAANAYRRVSGILNGTCNYILTTMEKTGRDFADVLAEAQAKGYAEADPSFDIDGIDTAHKLSIIAGLAFQCFPDLGSQHVEGIRHIAASDIAFAAELGYRIKLLGITERQGGNIVQRVHPAMIPLHSPLATVDDAYNALQIEGDAAGRLFLEGRGAGEGPTASAVVADLLDLARGYVMPPFIARHARLSPMPTGDLSALVCEYYLRLHVLDKPGVLADVACVCRDAGISVASLIQHAHRPDEAVDIVLTTHQTSERHMQRALDAMKAIGSIIGQPQMIRIEAP